jgi:hypothetical protein
MQKSPIAEANLLRQALGLFWGRGGDASSSAEMAVTDFDTQTRLLPFFRGSASAKVTLELFTFVIRNLITYNLSRR